MNNPCEIPTSFAIPKRHQRQCYRITIDNTVYAIEPKTRKSLSFAWTIYGQDMTMDNDHRRYVLDWIQESIEHLRSLCQR